MAHLPQQVRTCSGVPNKKKKNLIAADIIVLRIFLDDFLYYIYNGM